jgi:TfoX/Sxy family transcriptional regulator of competence genes
MKKGTGWPKASEEKGKRLDELASGLQAEKRKMFGAPVYFVNGNMYAGVFADHIFLRLPEQERERLEASGKAVPFEPVEGRRMKEYVVLDERTLAAQEEARALFEKSHAFVGKLKKK